MKNEKIIPPKVKQSFGGDFQHKSVFLVVDGISTGRYLAPLLRGYGYDVIHVQSKLAQRFGASPKEFDYVETFKESDNIDELFQELSRYNIRAVLTGAEAGMELADLINEKLGLSTRNDFSKSRARRNKYLMQEIVRQHGLRAPHQILTDDLSVLLDWARKNGMPVVLKPEESSGTDNVHFCYHESEVREAFEKIMSSKNIFKQQNTHVVVQELLIGEEYMVNTVSFGNTIYFTDIILSQKKIVQGTPLYDYALLIKPTDPEFKKISEYVSQVLPVLGIRYGATHTEVIITKNGPTLIEVNARLMGTYDMSAILEAIGTNQVEVLVNSYIKENYLKTLSERPKSNIKSTLTSFFIVEREGTLIKTPDSKVFSEMKCFHSMKFTPALGNKLSKTTSIFNTPGMVNFVGTNKEELLDAHSNFREREKSFYKEILEHADEKSQFRLSSVNLVDSLLNPKNTIKSNKEDSVPDTVIRSSL